LRRRHNGGKRMLEAIIVADVGDGACGQHPEG
jgi:hypothetical protein